MMSKWWLSLFLTLFFSIASAQTDFKIITLQHRFAQDILPVVQPMVGEDGNASAIDNHLLIHATPERMSAIEQVIATLDTARKNLRITISHEDISQKQSSHTGVAGRGRIGNAHVGVNESQLPQGTREGVVLDIGQSSGDVQLRGSEFLTVLDGSRAFIHVGKSVPYTQQWVTLTQRYLHVQQVTEFRDITTGFAVRPRVVGDQIELEITPRIAKLNDAGFIDFEELSTVVRVTPGQWFDLGGTMQSKDEVSRLILSRQKASSDRESNLMIKVDSGL